MVWRFWFVRADDGTPLLSGSGIPLCVQGRTARADGVRPPVVARRRALERAQALADERMCDVQIKMQRGLEPSRLLDQVYYCRQIP